MALSKEVMTQRVGTGVARLEGVFDSPSTDIPIDFQNQMAGLERVSLQWNVLYKHYPEWLKVMGK